MFHMVALWGLALALLQPACGVPSLGAVVHVVPQGQNVRAHFTVVAPSPCPGLTGVCDPAEDCEVHTASVPLAGWQPSDWCVRQWQKTVSSLYSATITLGSSVSFYVSVNATPIVRANNGQLNRPPYVALPPPLRARVHCPHHIHLAVKDLDGDDVRCRFARPRECPDCTPHTFIELDKEHCMVTFTGDGPVGTYYIAVMVEDHYPAPEGYAAVSRQALSSVPVHLSLTVEQSSTPCSAEPMASSQTPRENVLIEILPYEQVDLTVGFFSQESVSEIAVVGPPALFRSHLSSAGSLGSMRLSWVRGENSLAPLLPICVSANTYSLQSEPRCLWLYQRQIKRLPAGSVLTCEKTDMSLEIPLASLPTVKLSELQLNSATCPVTYNSTHLTALIALTGCGTKKVHAGSELVYTNTLQSVRPFSMITRTPKLVLPLACRIPGLVARGPHYNVSRPTDAEVFGQYVSVTMEIRQVASSPAGRKRRNVASQSGGAAVGSRLSALELVVTSNFTKAAVKLMVENCTESETGDMANASVLMDNGCSSTRASGTNGIMSMVSSTDNTTVYRLDLTAMSAQGLTQGSTTMYVECTMRLCIALMPNQKCSSLCTTGTVETSMISRTYTTRSGAVSLVVTTPAPSVTIVSTTPTAATASQPPQVASSITVGVLLVAVCVFLN